MPTEIEAKLKVDSLAATAGRCKRLGGEFLGKLTQRDYYFDDAEKSLTRSDCCLRLREEWAGRSGRVVLAYKGARQKGGFKKRREVEIELGESRQVRTLLAAIGYKEMLVFEKKRRLWLVGGCEVAFDELPLLGSFVEIEGKSEKQIAKVQKLLGLDDLPHIKESYAALMEEAIKKKGGKKMEVFFKGRNR